jgi:nucleoside-diphosphate-sugar epimerase
LRVFMTGGSGVLGRAVRPLLTSAGHAVTAPGSRDSGLFAPAAVTAAVAVRTRSCIWRSGAALAAALTAAPGSCNVTDGGGAGSSARFTAATGWRPGH